MIAANPGHSQWYIQRFKSMAASGADLLGEARLLDALAPRTARILDAGCGPGRHAGALHRLGHQVVGIDLDPALIAAAEQDDPGPRYLVGDLAGFELPADVPQQYDLILCAGNVMTFLHPMTRVAVLTRFGRWLAPEGRAVIGFGMGRGYELADFESDVTASGLTFGQCFSTWNLRRLTPESTFLVALLEHPA